MNWRGFAKRWLPHNGTIGPRETELKQQCQELHPDFVDLVNRVLSVHVLRVSKIDAGEVKWLRNCSGKANSSPG